VREVREREARVGLAHLVVRDDRGERVHSRASVLGGHRDAEQPKLAALLEESAIQRPLAVVLVRLRLDGLAREIANRLPEEAVLVGRIVEIGIECLRLTHGRPPRFSVAVRPS
jgi:hypothetical protein